MSPDGKHDPGITAILIMVAAAFVVYLVALYTATH